MELYYIWLESIKGLGPLRWHMLLKEFGTPYEIYVNRNHLSPQGTITAHCLNLIKEGSEKAMEEAKQNQEFTIMLYYKGTIKERWTHGAGIVGARRRQNFKR